MIANDIHPDDKRGYQRRPRNPSAFDKACRFIPAQPVTFPASYNSISVNAFRERCRLAGWTERQIENHLATFCG